MPRTDNIRGALENHGLKLTLQPTGTYAANLLGLTEQVPIRVAFLTDGTSRTIRVGNQEIHPRHTTVSHKNKSKFGI